MNFWKREEKNEYNCISNNFFSYKKERIRSTYGCNVVEDKLIQCALSFYCRRQPFSFVFFNILVSGMPVAYVAPAPWFSLGAHVIVT